VGRVVTDLFHDPLRDVWVLLACGLTTAIVQWTSPSINSSRLAGVKLWAVITLQTQW